MGDRGNIRIYQDEDGEESVYLYTHSRGSEIYGILKRALSKRWRWDDPVYLARIIFEEMVDVRGTDTGFGISTQLTDNEHTVLGVDCFAQEITFENEDGVPKSTVSFEEFVNRRDKWSV